MVLVEQRGDGLSSQAGVGLVPEVELQVEAGRDGVVGRNETQGVGRLSK